MPIRRNTDQKSKTLIEFYSELKNDSDVISKGVGTLMLNWIDKINSEFKETEIWGLTSHYHLTLQNKNDYTSKTYVVLTTGMDEYHIEYLIPKELEPWKNAFVKGATKSLDEAMEMLITAMINSRGWCKSTELNKLKTDEKKLNHSFMD
ncbi:hypothetical protein FG167_08510 [Lacinutrix sp. WUR7]|uniref:hypothetical protein n=1 Tax=Lacinutrix sp. WUR7 TaxID=2653681 RepID=UPI00193CA3A5|nr:hypothetical protein [Lacinutrix sp. WUR7]QRM89272.1 hypothetical protein FG167_08510 [Lacinutrix sp. WUR7]